MKSKSQLWEKRWLLRNIFSTFFFNFHYLPVKQAIKLPILLYKPHFRAMKGKIIVDAPIKTGMIILGQNMVGVYPNNGFNWENNGGTVIFKGSFLLGNDSFLSFGENTLVEFGDDFRSNAGLKLVSNVGVKFGKSTRVGWGTLIMDTNFHCLYDIVNKCYKKSSGVIEIGDYNWFGTQCKIMHSVKTPERCIFGMGTTVTRNCEMKSYCVMGGSPVRVLSENVMRDYERDSEE